MLEEPEQNNVALTGSGNGRPSEDHPLFGNPPTSNNGGPVEIHCDGCEKIEMIAQENELLNNPISSDA